MEQLQLSTGDYSAIAAIIPRDSEGGIFWREFLKTGYEDILHLLQEKNVYTAAQVSLLLLSLILRAGVRRLPFNVGTG